MGAASVTSLKDISVDDLAALRLSAQIMAHRAALAGRPRAAVYFEMIESAVMAELAARGQTGAARDERPEGGSATGAFLLPAANAVDLALIEEYLSQLTDNAGLTEVVRGYFRALRAELAP